MKRLNIFKIHSQFGKYSINTLWMLTEQILRLLAGFFVGIWVARFLGPDQFGIYSYSLAFAGIFTGIAKLGLDNIIVRELVKYPEKSNFYLGTAFWMKLIGAFCLLIIVGIMLLVIPNEFHVKIYIFIIASGIIFQSFEVIDFYFQSKVMSKFVSLSKMFQLIISSALKIYFVLSESELVYFVILSVIDQLTLAIALIYAYYKQSSSQFYKYFDWALAKQLFSYSWPLLFSLFAVSLYMRVGQLMIKELLGVREVGLYAAAIRICEVWYYVPAILASSLFPAIIKAKESGTERYYLRLQQFYSLMIWGAIIIAIPVTVFSHEIISILYGQHYKGAENVLVIYVWGGVFVFLGIAFSRFLVAENMNHKQLQRTLAGLTVLIILNLILIPKMGISGAALSMLLTQLIVNYLYDFFDSDLRPLVHLKTMAFVQPYKTFKLFGSKG